MKPWIFMLLLYTTVVATAEEISQPTISTQPEEGQTNSEKISTQPEEGQTNSEKISSEENQPLEPKEEFKVSFVRSKTSKKVEKPEESEATTVVVTPIQHFNATANETKPQETMVKVQPAKTRRRKQFGTRRRVFADRVFGKKYGPGKPRVVVNKLKDLLTNGTEESLVKDEKSTNATLLFAISQKIKRDLNVWKSFFQRIKLLKADHELDETNVEGIEHDKNESQIENAELDGNSSLDSSLDLEPPKKALLTYREFVEKKISKLNRPQGLIKENGLKENQILYDEKFEEETVHVGGLPDEDHAPLEGNVLSVMAVP